jgi:hypothetical protein
MKKILISLVTFTIGFLGTKAQDSTTKVTFFGGLVGAGFVSVNDTKDISKFANLRVGVNFEKNISKKTLLKTWVSFDPGPNLILFQATSTTSLSKNWKIEYGYGQTPATLIRPFPLSVDGQFQFTAEAMPPGSALGGFVSYKETKIGLYRRSGYLEYHLAQSIGHLSIGLWATKKNNSGGTIQLVTDRVYLMGTVTNENKQALATSVQPIKKSRWKVVHDFGVWKGKITNNLLGLLYPLETKKFAAARFGFGYDFQNKSVGAFWLIGFEK